MAGPNNQGQSGNRNDTIAHIRQGGKKRTGDFATEQEVPLNKIGTRGGQKRAMKKAYRHQSR